MARGKRASGKTVASEGETPAPRPGLPLPSPEASTNLVIADIVLRAAGGLLRDRLEKGLITRHHDDDPKAHRLIEKRGVTKSAMLWGASHLARRSPIGLAVVAGGLAAKVFYDRGKRLEKKVRAKKPPKGDS
jgi:hypothetical protein